MMNKASFLRLATGRSALALGAGLSLLCGAGVAWAQEDLQPAPARISEAAIHADHETYKTTQGRIKALNDKGIEVDNYHLSKAQCWLDTSFHEYTRNDRGGYPQAALSESAKLIGALEAGTDPGWETPLVNGAEKLRPDLWARYDALKQHKGFKCAMQATACAEVELVHAGNEIHDGGWRHAKPYIQIAEDLLSKAEELANCLRSPNRLPHRRPQRPKPSALISPPSFVQVRPGDLAGLLPEGKGKLDELAQRLADGYVQIDTLRLTGHTDRLGSDAYNQRLSEQRAATIKQYLQSKGLKRAHRSPRRRRKPAHGSDHASASAPARTRRSPTASNPTAGSASKSSASAARR